MRRTLTRPAFAGIAALVLLPAIGGAALPSAAQAETVDPLTSSVQLFERVDGADRYAVAATLAETFEPGVSVMYVVSGERFPDALSAGPAASHEGGGLLLTAAATLPESTRQAVLRLEPQSLVVVGGPASVSDDVFAQLAELQPNIVRIGGADRYEVSRNVIDHAFVGTTSGPTFVATGTTFADALSAGPAAAHVDGPVLLLNNAETWIETPTRDLISRLGTEDVRIVGGGKSVNVYLEGTLREMVPSVTRYGGADRYEVAGNINLDVFARPADTVYLASGTVFADALSAGPIAGKLGAPLYLVTKTCYPASAAHGVQTYFLPTYVVMIGGQNTLSDDIARGADSGRC